MKDNTTGADVPSETMRRQAITVFELTKGYTPEQRAAAGNLLTTMEEMAGYVMQLAADNLALRAEVERLNTILQSTRSLFEGCRQASKEDAEQLKACREELAKAQERVWQSIEHDGPSKQPALYAMKVYDHFSYHTWLDPVRDRIPSNMTHWIELPQIK